MDPLLFSLASRRLFAEAASRFSVPRRPAPCSAHGPQVNCSMKVGGEPFILTRLRTAFPSGHSSNFASRASSASPSLSEAEPCDDGGLGMSARAGALGVGTISEPLAIGSCRSTDVSAADGLFLRLHGLQRPPYGACVVVAGQHHTRCVRCRWTRQESSHPHHLYCDVDDGRGRADAWRQRGWWAAVWMARQFPEPPVLVAAPQNHPRTALFDCLEQPKIAEALGAGLFVTEPVAIECGGFRHPRYGFGHYQLLYAHRDTASGFLEREFIAIAGISFGRYTMCSPTCDLCRVLDNRGTMSIRQVCQMVLINRDNAFLLRRCCTAYGMQRTALQSTELQVTTISQRVTVQSLLQNTPSNTSNTAPQSTGQAPTPHKADGASHRPKGLDAAMRNTGQAPAAHKHKTEGASHRPKGPDTATRDRMRPRGA